MTWYTGTCGIMAMSLLYRLTLWSVWGGGGGRGGFGSNGFVTKTQLFPIDGHYRTDVISSVGHPRSDSVVPLVLSTVCCAMTRTPALYYTGLLGQCQPS
jgi:hypothetical protein